MFDNRYSHGNKTLLSYCYNYYLTRSPYYDKK